MTVESAITKVMYQGNSSAREWPVPFEFSRAEDIRLLLSDESGTESEVAENYQVQVNESGDTSVIYPVAGQSLPPGAKLVIYRQTPLSQIVDLIYGGAFSPDTLERDGLDRAVMMIQELQEEVDRAVKIPITSEETPESVLGDIYGARDDAADSATAAALSATNAKQSEDNAKGSAVVAEDARERACQCADRAEEARNVAIGQAQATNLLMETEVAKINTIIGADADDRKLATEKARRWAEGEPGVPVDMDDDGNPKYSARHWANEAETVQLPTMSETTRGVARVGEGLGIVGDALGVTIGKGLEIDAAGKVAAQVTMADVTEAIQAIDALPILSKIDCPTGILRPGFLFTHLDNGLLTKAAFPDAYAQLVSDLDAGSEAIIEGDDAWQAQKLANGGVCPKFMLDVAAETFRIPLTPGLYAREPDPGKGLKAGDYLEDQFQGHGFGAPNYNPNQVLRMIINRYGGTAGSNGPSSVTRGDPEGTHAGGSQKLSFVADEFGNGEPRVGTETRPVSGVKPTMMKMYGAVTDASEANIAALIEATVRKLDTERFEVSQQVMHVRDEKPVGTPGGTFTAGAERVRDLNTVVTNTIPGASLANNQITLPAGSYDIEVNAPANQVAAFRTLLRSSDGVTLIVGSAMYANGSYTNTILGTVRGRINLLSETTIEICQRSSGTNATQGFGIPTGAGPAEVYSEVIIRRLS